MNSIKNISSIFNGVKCNKCRARLIVLDEEGRTIIKTKLMIIDDKKGVLEIKCRECGCIKTIISNN